MELFDYSGNFSSNLLHRYAKRHNKLQKSTQIISRQFDSRFKTLSSLYNDRTRLATETISQT